MSTSSQIINDIEPRSQFTATSNQFVFNTNWTANVASDVDVYARISTATASDVLDLVSTTEYTVEFVGDSATVRVTFMIGRTAGDIITIVRNTPADRTNLYTNTNFVPSMLNQDFGILTLVDQQNQMYDQDICPHYNVSASFKADTNIDLILPILTASQVWMMDDTETKIIGVDISGGAGGSVQPGLQNQIGYYPVDGIEIDGLTMINDGVLTTSNVGMPQIVNVLPPSIGGTGVNNALSTFTYGGNTSFSGAFSFIGNLTGNTNVTFPTSGTLATTAQVQVLFPISGISQTAVVNNGYVTYNVALTTITMPLTGVFGDKVLVQGYGSGGWIIQANAGQTLIVGDASSSVAGTIASTSPTDGIVLLCVVADTTWILFGNQTAQFDIN